MRDIRQDVQKRFSRLRSRSAERLSQRNVVNSNVASDRQLDDDDPRNLSESAVDDNYEEEVTPTAGKQKLFFKFSDWKVFGRISDFILREQDIFTHKQFNKNVLGILYLYIIFGPKKGAKKLL